jgi:hypothetical protein
VDGDEGGLVIVKVTNPVPVVSGLNPSSLSAGSSAFTLIVSGSHFVSGATVNWNGSPLATTYDSSTQLEVQVPQADLQTTGAVNVTVSNPIPNDGDSAPVTFTVANPIPSISKITPSSVLTGSPAFTMIVNGSQFALGAMIKWNGVPLATTFDSFTQLEAQVPQADLQTAGTASIIVSNPSPWGKNSLPATFTITNPIPILLSINPSSSPILWGSTFTITVTGSQFVPGATINWDGVPLPTMYDSSTQLEAQVPDIKTEFGQTGHVTVSNPTPGGGTTDPFEFTVTLPPHLLYIPLIKY